MFNKLKKLNVIKYISLTFYIILSLVLIIESCLSGDVSGEQSSQLGGHIANVFNDLSGDVTKEVLPEEVLITNKMSSARVGDTLTLNVNTFPSSSTYKSNKFSSSNTAVASISNDGRIEFLNEGKSTITVRNEKIETIEDSFEIEVKHIVASDFTSSIPSSEYDEENNYYVLYLNSTYSIKTEFNPLNTSDTKLNYSVSSNEYIDVDQQGLITPKKHSYNQIVRIDISYYDISHFINVIIKNPNIIDLKDIESNEIEIYQTQTKKLDFIFKPNNASFKDVEITTTSSDISLNNGYITGINVTNTASINVVSKHYPSINKNFSVKVKPLETNIIDFEVSYEKKITLGSTSKLNIYNSNPEFIDISKFEVISEDTNIISVEDNLTLKALAQGKVNITVKYQTIEKSFEIEVINKTSSISDFEVKYSSITLQDTFLLSSLVSLNGEYMFTSKDPSIAIPVGIKLEYVKDGVTSLLIRHLPSGTLKEVEIYSYASFVVRNSSKEEINSSIQLTTSSSYNFDISSTSKQIYELEHDDLITLESNNSSYIIKPLKEGQSIISIYILLDNLKIDTGVKLNVVIKNGCLFNTEMSLEYQIYTTSYSLHPTLNYRSRAVNSPNKSSILIKPVGVITKTVFNSKTQENEEVDTFFDLSSFLDKNIIHSVDNNNLVDLEQDGDFIKVFFKTFGKSTLTIKEEVSYTLASEENKDKYITSLDLIGYNKVITTASYNGLNYFVTGDTLVTQGNGVFTITNGNTAYLHVSFDYEKSTYTDVSYYSLNEDVASISSDGSITTLKEGTSKIGFVCYDGFTPSYVGEDRTLIINGYTYIAKGIQYKAEGELYLTVVRQELITDLNTFFLLVRKGLGHFGAFLVLGIFSSLTFILFFDKKKWVISIPINFVQGVSLAIITELIQLIVPGRQGLLSDVLIDSFGFLISSLIICALFIIKYLIKKKKN